MYNLPCRYQKNTGGNVFKCTLIFGIVFVFVFQPVLASPDPNPIPDSLYGKIHLFALVGQSNMVGYAPLPRIQKTSPTIYNFTMGYRWQIGREPTFTDDAHVDMVSYNTDPRFGAPRFSPGLPFALYLQDLRPDYPIGLIPCAHNYSSITDWQRNLSDQSLYGSCLKRIRAASTVGTLSGVLFYQGETDVVDSIRADAWAENFTQFVSDFRADTNSPNLPIVFAQIGPSWANPLQPYWTTVQDEQASISLPNVEMIRTSDLVLSNYHLNLSSEIEAGYRFAQAMDGLLLQEQP